MLKKLGKIVLTVLLLASLYECACYIYTQPLMDEIEATINGPVVVQRDRSSLPTIQRLFAPIDDGKTVRRVENVKRTIVFCGFKEASVSIVEQYSFNGNDLRDAMELRVVKDGEKWVVSRIIYRP